MKRFINTKKIITALFCASVAITVSCKDNNVEDAVEPTLILLRNCLNCLFG